MKILIIDPAVHNGEIYFRYIDYAAAIRKNGYDVEHILPRNIGIKSRPTLTGFLSVVWQIIRLRRSFDAAIIPTKTMLWFFVWLCKKVLKKKTIIDHIASYVSVRERYPLLPSFLERRAYRKADAVVTFTHVMSRLIRERYRLPAEKMFVIYCLTNEDIFSFRRWSEESARLREAYGITDKFVVFYHGLHNPWHGVDVILRAAKLLENDPRFVFAFLPGDPEIPAGVYPNVLRLIEKKVADIPPYLGMADIWCSGVNSHPVASRLFATTMIQAILMGRPIMTSRNEEKGIFFKDKETVIFVSPDDPVDIVEKLRYYIDHRGDLAIIAERCSKDIAPRFTTANFTDTVARILR